MEGRLPRQVGCGRRTCRGTKIELSPESAKGGITISDLFERQFWLAAVSVLP